MKYYYEILFYKGGVIGGHNLEEFKIEEGFLVLKGYDGIDYTTGYQEHRWEFRYELTNIKCFKIEKMEEEHDEY